MLVTFEQTGDFCVSKEGVHPFEESRIEHVRFVHDEANLLAFASGAAENGSKILVKVGTRVFVGDFDLEDAETVHPRYKPG